MAAITKTNGAEWKKFYNDPKYWPSSSGLEEYKAKPHTWHDDTLLIVDGVEWGDDTDLGEIPDSASVIIDCGTVFNPFGNEQDDGMDLAQYFKKWKKEQNTVVLLVEINTDKMTMADAEVAIKKLGMKIKK